MRSRIPADWLRPDADIADDTGPLAARARALRAESWRARPDGARGFLLYVDNTPTAALVARSGREAETRGRAACRVPRGQRHRIRAVWLAAAPLGDVAAYLGTVFVA